jgi:hypothetical protein
MASSRSNVSFISSVGVLVLRTQWPINTGLHSLLKRCSCKNAEIRNAVSCQRKHKVSSCMIISIVCDSCQYSWDKREQLSRINTGLLNNITCFGFDSHSFIVKSVTGKRLSEQGSHFPRFHFLNFPAILMWLGFSVTRIYMYNNVLKKTCYYL